MPRILVVEDDLDVLDTVLMILEAEDYEVEGIADPRDALDRARALQPDLVISDLMMPHMSGYDVLETLRGDATLALTPFIFLTAKATPEAMRTGMGLGADDYLTKPFVLDDLLRAIETRLERRNTIKDRYAQREDVLRRELSVMLPHELRTPLMGIVGTAMLLRDGHDRMEKEDIDQMLGVLCESSERLQRLIENFLIYALLGNNAVLADEDTRVAINGGAITHAIAQRQAATHQRADDLVLSHTSDYVFMREAHLEKLVEEVVDNALRYSMSGTPVTVTLSVEDDVFQVQVTDQGRGMTPEQVSQIGAFTQFGRDHFEQQGIGLGLTICQMLVRLYNGSLEIQGEPGVGTTVRVILPQVVGRAEAGAEMVALW